MFFLKSRKTIFPCQIYQREDESLLSIVVVLSYSSSIVTKCVAEYVFYDAVADYGRKYMEYGIENGTVGKAWAW